MKVRCLLAAGILRVSQELTERARGAPYILKVRGEDGGGQSSEVNVEIYVEDAQSQDGKPRFRFPAEDGQVIDMPEVLRYLYPDEIHNVLSP